MLVFPIFAFVFSSKAAPVVPAGTNAAFQKAFQMVQSDLRPFDFRTMGSFADAARDAAALPTLDVTMTWDDRNVPPARREEFARARDAAVKAWQKEVPELKLTLGKEGRIQVAFENELPPNPDSPGPAGAVFMLSPSPNDPAVDAVISLTREATKHSVEAVDVQNEVAYAIGAYFGLERTENPGNIMWRREGSYFAGNRVAPEEARTVRATLASVAQLRQAIIKKSWLTPAQPSAFIQPAELTTEPVIQGTIAQMSFQVFNRGTAKLEIRVTPDCGCFRLDYPKTIEPGASGLVKVYVDTSEFPGNIQKSLYFYSNDTDIPMRRIPVSFRVEPLYRFINPSGNDIVVAGKDGASAEIVLALNPKQPMLVESVDFDGVPAKVSFEPWSGDLADPSINEPLMRREGYRIKIDLPADIIPGRSTGTIVVKTNSKDFPILRRTLYVQKGIAVLPLSVYFGELSRRPERAWVLLSRPERDFKVLKVESDNPSITAHVEPLKGNWEYKLVVEYDGKADFGNLSGMLQVHTNDPDQPVIAVPVTGVVR